MHSPSRLEASLRNSGERLPRISYGAKSLLPTAFGKLHEQLLALVHLLSRCYAPAAYPECHHQNNCYLSYNRCACSGCHSWLSFITVIIQAHPSLLPEHQLVRKSYTPHAACAYCIKLQRQGYMERRTTENNNNNTYMKNCNRAH